MADLCYEITDLQLSKRTYLPVAYKTICTSCGLDLILDLDDSYLSYPTTGERMKKHIYCRECDSDDTVVELKLEMTLTIFDKT